MVEYILTGYGADHLWGNIGPYMEWRYPNLHHLDWRQHNGTTVSLIEPKVNADASAFAACYFHALLHFGESYTVRTYAKSRLQYFKRLWNANKKILRPVDPGYKVSIVLCDTLPGAMYLKQYSPFPTKGRFTINLNKYDGYTSVIPLSKYGYERYWNNGASWKRIWSDDRISQFELGKGDILPEGMRNSNGFSYLYIQAAGRTGYMKRRYAKKGVPACVAKRDYDGVSAFALVKNCLLEHIATHLPEYDEKHGFGNVMFLFEEYEKEVISGMLGMIGMNLKDAEVCLSKDGKPFYRYSMRRGDAAEKMIKNHIDEYR